MFQGTWRRRIAAAALAAIAAQAAGCASTDRYLLDPQPQEPAKLASVGGTSRSTRFDAAGGTIDVAAGVVSGPVKGDTVTVPLGKHTRLGLFDARFRPKTFKVNPRALIEHDLWSPDGRVHYIALRSGDLLDVRRLATTVDARRRVVLCGGGDPVREIPFDRIEYLQVKDGHPGRTAALVLGVVAVAGIAALAIVFSSMGPYMSFGG